MEKSICQVHNRIAENDLLDVVVVKVLVLDVVFAVVLFVASGHELDQLHGGLRPDGDEGVVGASNQQSLNFVKVDFQIVVFTVVKRMKQT